MPYSTESMNMMLYSKKKKKDFADGSKFTDLLNKEDNLLDQYDYIGP